MIEISVPSLIVAIQAVRRQADAERAQLEAMDEDDEDAGDLSVSLSDLEKTLNELRGAYDKARGEGYDLPPSGSLFL
ncbi:hypothetical protein RM190_08825 [Paracoccus sp. CPCC 101403]|uniref:Uncharacterized protein n=2 Tax=Paracoccus broussonetiae TaxID=3075834 RepID=A0ABU3ECV4_9RHOB|nr:hypothetical protein [Paracoccus sp. CPCC 101403]MDT1061956.1 hypothetical protein [Paracoccus sp. CPCC 101403]